MLNSLSRHERLLFIVDQRATLDALPPTVTRNQGIPVGYLPGLAM